MKRILIKLGIHGVRTRIGIAKMCAWMHQNGLGA